MYMFSRNGQLKIQGEAELLTEMIMEQEEALRQLEVRISHIYLSIYAVLLVFNEKLFKSSSNQ